MVSRIRAAGLTGEIHWVSGQPDLRTTVWGPLKLLRDARTNLALTVAHVYALMVIDDERHHAWVFEDDVIFHDRFRELFPVYWSDPKASGRFPVYWSDPKGSGRLVAPAVLATPEMSDGHG